MHISVQKILEIVVKVAPMVAALLSGNPLAALSLLSTVFGGSADSPHQVLKNIEDDPDAQAKLIKLEDDHSENVQRMILENQQLNEQEAQRASDLEVKLSTLGKHDWIHPTIALSFIAMFFIYIALYMSHVVPKDAMIIGDLHSIVMIIINHYFSSKFKAFQSE